jgi:hypothetical protein
MGALAGVIAAVIWYYLRPTKPPTFVLLTITEYTDPHLPPNPLGDQDRKILNRPSWINAYQSQQEDLLRTQLRNLRTQDKKQPLVFYLSGLALPNATGEVCLLPGDADADNAKGHWVPMRDVLDEIIACPAEHKLLILDVMRPIADPRLGVLGNDVAARLQPMLEKAVADHPNLLILCACAPGQMSLSSEALGRSAFVHYIEEGLRGRADGYNDKNERDGKVTAWELARFVTARVDRWARQNRKEARQTPVMHGSPESDFNLVVLEHARAQEHPPAEGEWLTNYPDWLQAGWAERDKWWKEQSFRRMPRAFRQLEVALLRAERRWRSGVADDLVRKDLEKEIAELKRQDALARAELPPLPRRSLAQAIAQGQKPNPATKEALKKLLSRLEEAGPNPKAEEAKMLLEERKKFLKDKDKDELDVAAAVFDEALPSSSRPKRLQFLYELLREVQPEPRYVETLWLYRLDRLASQVEGAWPATVVRRSLEVVRDGERAAACDPYGQGLSEPRAFPWVQHRLELAAQMRHDGEVRLLAPRYASADEAGDLLEKAAADYKSINNYLEVITQAYDQYDRALALLPGLLPYLMAQPSLDPQDEKSWKGALDGVGKLYDLWVLAPVELYQKRDELPQMTHDLRVDLDHFEKLIDTRQAELKAELDRAEFSDELALLAKMDLLLELPWVKAADRAKLWVAREMVAERVQDRTTKLDWAEDEEREVKQTQRPPDFDAKRAEAVEQERAFRRAQLLWMYLQASGLVDEGELEKMLQGHGPDLAGLPALGQLLRKAWTERLPNQLEKEKGLAQDRLSRAAHPLDRLPALANAATNPSVQLHKGALQALKEWLGRRCLYEEYDLRGLGGDTVAENFYESAARAYEVEVGTLPMRFTSESETPDLRDSRAKASYTFLLTLESPLPPDKIQQQQIHPVRTDGDLLDVRVEKLEQPPGKNAVRVPLTILLNQGSGSSGPLPKGFLLAVKVQGRPFYYRVDALVQESAEKRVQVLVSENPNAGDNPREFTAQSRKLQLRPNIRQPVYVFIRNPTDKERNLAVEVTAEGVEGKLESKPKKVAPGKTERIAFDGKPSAAADKPSEGLLRLPETGLLLVKLLDAENKNEAVDKKRVEVKVSTPQDYLDAKMQYEPRVEGGKNRLTVRVWPTAPVSGPVCHVKMELRIPGFKKAAAPLPECDLALSSEKEELLILKDLEFDGNRPDENGEVHLTVDGYKRAFIFRTTFATGGGAPPTSERVQRPPRLRLAVPPGAVTKQAEVPVEVDNSESSVQIRVSFQREENGAFNPMPLLPGDRLQRISFGGGKEGLVFETELADHVVKLGTANIPGGQRALKAELLDKSSDKPITTTVAKLLIDNTGPENVRFLSIGGVDIQELMPGADPVRVPVEVEQGTAELQVSARGSSPYSEIGEVSFFFGKLMDGKPAGTPVKARRQAGTDVWTARLPLEPGRMGPMDVTVRFLTGAGLEKPLTTPINLVIKPPKEPPKVGTIKGKVLDEDDRGQPKVKVVLSKKDPMAKDKLKEVDSTTTDEDKDRGAFVFKNVEPGEYVISAETVLNKGQTEVKVEVGKETTANIKLKRK